MTKTPTSIARSLLRATGGGGMPSSSLGGGSRSVMRVSR